MIKSWKKGFTLIELMIVVAILGVLAVVAIPTFINYFKKAKTTEATEAIDKINKGAKTYFESPKVDIAGITLECQFPNGAGPTPATGSPCGAAGTTMTGDGKWKGSAGNWTGSTWKSLLFSMSDDHYYSYQFTKGEAQGSMSLDGATFRDGYKINAYGDLDCDSTLSTYTKTGAGWVGATNYVECQVRPSPGINEGDDPLE